jgi:hypothetical protein
MNRLKRFAWLVAGLAAVGLAVTLATEGRAIAQVVRAALVRNQDEPGRNPYSQKNTCFGSDCAVTFAPVPAGQRLVVTFVNGVGESSAQGMLVLAGDGTNERFLPTTLFSGSVYANSPVVAFFEAGETPQVACVGCSGPGLKATLSGYFITLP